jgi:hypothetical protein
VTVFLGTRRLPLYAAAVHFSGNSRRRWLGVIALGVAVLMLVAAETVLEGKIPPLWLLLYWLVCFVATGVAVVLALREARDLQNQARAEQRALFDRTLKEIEAEARQRQPKPPAPPPPSAS